MINITDMQKETKVLPLWRQAFRPFFLFGTLFAIIAMSIWIGVLNGWLSFTPVGSVFFWHAHEMMFGFVSAIVVGFLLTAVQNWTGLRATHGWSLATLFFIWLTARILLAFDFGFPHLFVALIDCSFYLFAALLMARLVIKANNIRNLFFAVILVLLGSFNMLTHVGVIAGIQGYVQQGLYAAVMQISLMMVIIAGRVFPMFTANGTGTEKALPLMWLERSCITLSITLVPIFLFGLNNAIPDELMAILFGLACASNSIRAIRWRPWVTLGVPLVWSLHLAYWFIPFSFGLFTLYYSGFIESISVAIHGLTAGAMSSLILAMIARVSLGHSGRPLLLHPSMAFAFGLIIMAGLFRITAGVFPQFLPGTSYLISGVIWIIAYLLYVVNYSRILTTARPDGRPG